MTKTARPHNDTLTLEVSLVAFPGTAVCVDSTCARASIEGHATCSACNGCGRCIRQLRGVEPHTLVVGQLACRYYFAVGPESFETSSCWPLATADMLHGLCRHALVAAAQALQRPDRGRAPHMKQDIRQHSSLSQPVQRKQDIMSAAPAA